MALLKPGVYAISLPGEEARSKAGVKQKAEGYDEEEGEGDSDEGEGEEAEEEEE